MDTAVQLDCLGMGPGQGESKSDREALLQEGPWRSVKFGEASLAPQVPK